MKNSKSPEIIKSLVLQGPCPDICSETTTLFLKRKEINKKPVAMLAYVLCKTEGRMKKKNKIKLSLPMEKDKSGKERPANS